MESSSSLNSVIMESRILRSGSVFKGLNKVQNFEVEVVVDEAIRFNPKNVRQLSHD